MASAAWRRADAEAEADGLAVRADVLGPPDTVRHSAVAAMTGFADQVQKGQAITPRRCRAARAGITGDDDRPGR